MVNSGVVGHGTPPAISVSATIEPTVSIGLGVRGRTAQYRTLRMLRPLHTDAMNRSGFTLLPVEALAQGLQEHRHESEQDPPDRPQTVGKAERFHRILLEVWVYIRPWRSETQRAEGYVGFIHFYNHHRPHGSLKWATPISIITDNLPEEQI